MCLVDNYKRQFPLPHICQKAFGTEALGSDIQQLDIAEATTLADHIHLVTSHARVQACGTHTAVGEIIDLVFHQRNQRRNHQRQARQKKGGHLECQGFSASCGQKAYGVAPVEHGTYNFLLTRTERIIAPVPG